MAGDDAFIVALVTNAIIFVVVFLVFCYLRTKKPQIYQPRCTLVDNPPTPLSDGFFSWISEVLKITDDEFYQQSGLDALMYTWYFRFGMKLFAFCCIYGGVLIAVNASAGCPIDECPDGLDTITKLSISNVESGSHRFWAHLFGVYIFSGFAMYLLRGFWTQWLSYRLRYLAEDRPHHRAVLVRDIPKDTQGVEQLKGYFETLYEGEVSSVACPKNTGKLRKLLKKRQAKAWQVEHVRAVIAQKGQRPKARKGGFCCFGGTKMDAEELREAELAEFNTLSTDMLKAINAHADYLPGGVVAFHKRETATHAAQVVHSPLPATMDVIPAPQPQEIYWPNLKMSFVQRSIRHSVFAFVTYCLILLWMIPVAFVSSLTTLSNLCSLASFICDITDISPVLSGFLEGFLPTLALIIFFAILPMICTMLSRAQGFPSESIINEEMMKKLYLFFVVNIFVGSIVGGSLLSDTDEIFEKPVDVLGKSIPETGTFFTTYIMILAFSAFPLGLLRIGPLIVSWIKLKWLAKTPRERRLAVMPGAFNYGTALPKQLLAVLIGLTFSCVAPIILPFMTVFFAVGYLTYRYQLFYVNIKNYETGGRLWPNLFNRTMVGILLSEVVVFAILLIKTASGIVDGAIQVPLMVPLIIATIWFWRYCNSVYDRVATFIPQEVLHEQTDDLSELDAHLYTQPELLEPEVLEAGDGVSPEKPEKTRPVEDTEDVAVLIET